MRLLQNVLSSVQFFVLVLYCIQGAALLLFLQDGFSGCFRLNRLWQFADCGSAVKHYQLCLRLKYCVAMLVGR